MLGRRSLRTKTMQHLYAFELNKDNSLSGIESQLQKSCDKTTALFLTLLTYLYEVGQYSLVDAGIKMAKYIKKEDEIINTQLAAVPVLKNLYDLNSLCCIARNNFLVCSRCLFDLIAYSS